MANNSFDYGYGHFLCLDSNVYLDPTDASFQRWIADDLAGTDAAWKFVVYHHPAFNVGLEHYAEQHMRVLSPTFEQHGVSLVLSGHEHNFQHSRAEGIDYFITGAGGKVRLEPPSDFAEAHTTDWAAAGNFLVVEVTADRMVVNAMAALGPEGELKELQTFDPAGRRSASTFVIDRE